MKKYLILFVLFSMYASHVYADVTPPVLSAGSPSGTITATTTVNLSLTTDENSTCRYSSVAGISYASATTTFSTTGGTAHSKNIVYMYAGTHTFYIRCIDLSSNANTSDYAISFTIPVAAPAFIDTFDSGALSVPQAGYGWGDSASVSVSATTPYSGNYALQFSFGPNALTADADSWSEQRFVLGQYQTEAWFDYMLYVPSNYFHRAVLNQSDTFNNKFFALWRDDYAGFSDWRPRIEVEPNAAGGTSPSNPSNAAIGTSRIRAVSTDSSIYLSGQSTDISAPQINAIPDFITPSGPVTIGGWTKVRIHLRAETASSTNDGIMEVWANKNLAYQKTNGDFIGFGGIRELHNGYLLGYANSGFTDLTRLYIDNFKIYNADPGWSLSDVVAPGIVVTSPLNGSTISASTITLSAISTDDISVSGVQFKLDTNTNIGSEITGANVALATTTLSLGSVSNGTHTLIAVARDSSGNYATSSPVSVIISNASVDTTAPSTPTSLTATALSTTQINLSWTASTDNVLVTGYKIYRGGTQITTSLTNSYADTSLSPSTSYTYTVSAYDAAANNSALSSSVSATTQATPVSSSGGGGGGSRVTTQVQTSPSLAPEIIALILANRALFMKAVTYNITLPQFILDVLNISNGAPTLGSTYTRDLTLGSQGSDVQFLQTYLIQKNTGPRAGSLRASGASGYFGTLTQAALLEYQLIQGIFPATGYFGPLTRGRIGGN